MFSVIAKESDAQMVIKQYNEIFYIIGLLVILISLTMLFPLLLAILLNESGDIIFGYFFTFIIGLSIGIYLYYFNKVELKLNIKTSIIICVLGWIAASIIAAIPLVLGFELSFLDAFFQAVSGFTTTGMVVIRNIESKPLSLIFYLSFIQWLGGLGILSFFLLITVRREGEVWTLFLAESHKLSPGRPVPNLFKTIKIFWGIYSGLTFIQFILLNIAGIGAFNSMIHAFTTISTGGFSNFNASIGYFQRAGNYNYRIIEYIFILFMILGGTSFLIHYKIINKEWKDIKNNIEFTYFIKLITGFTLLITILTFFNRNLSLSLYNLEQTFRTGLFQVVAMITSTGYQTEYIGSPYFSAAVRQLFLLLMFIGGCVGSTSGGFKTLRIIIMQKLFSYQLKIITYPRGAVKPLIINKQSIDWEDVYHVIGIFFGWFILIFVGGLITSIFSNYDLITSFSGMHSAVNNIGPSYIEMGEIADLHPVIKISYIIGMISGRLEIIPVAVLFNKMFWK